VWGERRDEEVVLRKRLAIVLAAALMVALSSTPAFAASNPSGTGKPNQSCEEQPTSPPGFKSGGFANAEEHYNPGSQYDVACYQVSHKGGSNK
jgi:hypothetical protein